MTIQIASVDSVILYFDDSISKQTSLLVKSAYKTLFDLHHEGIIELIPSYTSLLIRYDIFHFDYDSIQAFVQEQLKALKPLKDSHTKPLNIDVYYGTEVGVDLQRIASHTKLSIEEIIHLHSSKIYDVFAIGFLPGFAYLASVDKKLQIPRLKSPRKLVPKGSVCIAQSQTAIYPQNSPGGWNILGRTSYEVVDKNASQLSPINIESKIKFHSICKEAFIDQGGVL